MERRDFVKTAYTILVGSMLPNLANSGESSPIIDPTDLSDIGFDKQLDWIKNAIASYDILKSGHCLGWSNQNQNFQYYIFEWDFENRKREVGILWFIMGKLINEKDWVVGVLMHDKDCSIKFVHVDHTEGDLFRADLPAFVFCKIMVDDCSPYKLPRFSWEEIKLMIDDLTIAYCNRYYLRDTEIVTNPYSIDLTHGVGNFGKLDFEKFLKANHL